MAKQNTYDVKRLRRALVALVLALVILLTASVTVGYYSKGYTDWTAFGAPAQNAGVDGGALAVGDIVNGDRVMLTATTASDEDGYISKTLTATVLPAEAPDKSVDWTTAWADGASRAAEAVTDYITISTDADGSNVATVTCIRAFDGDQIIITVTTRIGGYKATCTASFVGAPTTLSIDDSALSYAKDSGWDVNIANVEVGTTYNFDLNLGNIYNSVGSAFTPTYKIDLSGFGSIILTRTYKADPYAVTEVTAGLNDEMNYYTKDGVDYSVTIMENLLSASINDGILTLKPFIILSNFHKQSYHPGSDHKNYTAFDFKQYSDTNKMPYVKITVTETNTGIADAIYVRTVSAVNSVSLDNSTLSF